MIKELDVYILGIQKFDNCLKLQNRIHQLCVENKMKPCVLVVEHPPVITLGKNSNIKHLLTQESMLKKQKILLHTCNRGGEITAHMPGQLILYPILPMSFFDYSVRKFICFLELLVIKTLSKFGVNSYQDKQHPGIWVLNKKICAIGVRIKKRISMHGLALNISNSLDLYKHIIPCGIHERGVTSLNLNTKTPSTTKDVIPVLIKNLVYSLDNIKHNIMYVNNLESIYNLKANK